MGKSYKLEITKPHAVRVINSRIVQSDSFALTDSGNTQCRGHGT